MYYARAMPKSTSLLPGVKRPLAGRAPMTYLSAKRFIGSDKRPGDVALQVKRLLRGRCQGR
jgi:hypothetical protein